MPVIVASGTTNTVVVDDRRSVAAVSGKASTVQVPSSTPAAAAVVDRAQLVNVSSPGPQGKQGLPGLSGAMELDGAIRPSYVSDHPGTLTKGMAVCLINGKLRRATIQSPFHIAVGLVFEDTLLQGVSGRIQTDLNFITTTAMWDAATGMIGGLAPGQPYFLTETGAITPFAPTATGQYVSPIGLALSPTSLRIEVSASVLL